MYAHTQTFLSKNHGRSIVQKKDFSSFLLPQRTVLLPKQILLYINYACGFSFQTLADMLDSLVRVSRRDEKKHFVLVSWPPNRHPIITQMISSFLWIHVKKEEPASRLVVTKHAFWDLCFLSVPIQQFQVLFHSLFKVLFIFPSRYLFAIGLPPIFSFRWNLPPT